MIATMPPTGCTCTSSMLHCHRASGTTMTMSCWECPYFGPNINTQMTYRLERDEAVRKDKKKSNAQKVRDNLKNLPRNRKSMRY